MSKPLPPNEGTIQIEATSFTSLLTNGIECIRQGAYGDGKACLSLARQQLSPHQAHVAAALDSLLQACEEYYQSQLLLHVASRRFAEAEMAQQTCLSALQTLTNTLYTQSNSSPSSSPPAHTFKLLSVSPSQEATQTKATTPLQDQHRRGTFVLSFHADTQRFALPALYITCFGHFTVRRLNHHIALCHNRNGQLVLRYLMTQPGYAAATDTLMDILWPKDDPDVARRKLQIAVSALRRSLNEGYTNDAGNGYILHRDHSYLLNPAVTIRTDVDEFLSLSQVAQSTPEDILIEQYEHACSVYTAPFLLDDLYTDWSMPRREQLRRIYLGLCHVVADHYLQTGHYDEAQSWASKILVEDRCDEGAHRQLIRAYIMQGQRNEALHQYQRCKRILAEELGVAPTAETFNPIQELLTDETFKRQK